MCVLLALIFCYGSITMCALLDGAELQLGTVVSAVLSRGQKNEMYCLQLS